LEELRKIIGRIEEGAFLVVKGKEQTNVMTIGWAMCGVVWRRPMMMVAVRTSRHTYKLIEQADSFTVSFPADDRKKELNLCGSKSGRDLDKFKECGFAAAPSRNSRGPFRVPDPLQDPHGPEDPLSGPRQYLPGQGLPHPLLWRDPGILPDLIVAGCWFLVTGSKRMAETSNGKRVAGSLDLRSETRTRPPTRKRF
jgi:hypothetical protein